MSTTTVTGVSRHELATRSNGGLEVTLFWDRRDDSISIDLHHDATDETFSFRVPPGLALDAFHHPFAHLGSLELDLQPDDIDDPGRN